MADQRARVTFAELMHRGILEIGDGYRAKNSELGGDGPIFMRAGRLTQSGWDWDGVERFHAELTAKVTSKMAKPRDTVITTKGNSTGRTGYVPDDAPQFVYSPHLSYWRSTNSDELDARYLRYWALSSEFHSQLKAMAHGTDMAPYLSLSDQKRIEIALPLVERQRGIAEVLGALDDKIAANDRIAATADSLRSAYCAGAHAEAPGEFRQEALSGAAEFINGRPFTKDATGTGRMVVRIAELNSGPGSSTVYNEIEVPEKHLARPGDVLFAWSGSLTVGRWFRPEAIVNQHIFKVVPKDGRPMWLVAELLRLKLDEFRAIAADKATTMGHIQRRHLDEPVLTPNAAMTQKLDAQIGPLWDRALTAEQESLKLAELRDILLPHLMSGKLRVRDAEKIVEDAV
ncbi:restriction endonuclease subunit S [Streptomyces sp. NPDC056817]|uniref:restriction endonuclease subunit S n=1 Tax=Streptomyces sp. NPDC056817 TaxID=3345950 RepID=UPI0036987940